MLFAGIDAGQSSTSAVIGDEAGVVLGRGSAGPADEVGAGASSTRLRDALSEALSTALADAKLANDVRFERIVVGLSGYEGRIYGVAPELPTSQLRIVHDGEIAHAAALGGESGVVVIAGTGSVAIASEDFGAAHTIGGWGYVFGDEGSAFWIARTAMQAAIAHDPCPSEKELLSFFHRTSLREIARAVYANEISRATFAGFARTCIEAARERRGCACICDVPHAAARELALLAARAAEHVPTSARLSFVGGLVADAWFREQVETAAHGILAHHTIVAPQHEPVIGALWLARHA